MTITIELPEDLLARLRADAQAQGRPPEELAAEQLALAYAALPEPPVASVHDHDAAAYAALVKSGDADFAAGRKKTLEAMRAGMEERHGLKL